MANELVNVGDFRFVPEAEPGRLHLDEEGIRAFVSNAEMLNINWLLESSIRHSAFLLPYRCRSRKKSSTSRTTRSPARAST